MEGIQQVRDCSADEPSCIPDRSTQGHAQWEPAINSCALSDTYKYRWGLLVNLLVEIVLLAIMFAGVLSKRNGTGLWRVLYVQVRSYTSTSESESFLILGRKGIVWMLVAGFSKLPSVVSSQLLDRHHIGSERSGIVRS